MKFYTMFSYKKREMNDAQMVALMTGLQFRGLELDELKGFQFRGIVSFVTDEPKKTEIKEDIIKKVLEKNSSEKIKKLGEKKEVQVILFEPKVCYSLNPEEFSDMCIGSDVDSTHLFQK